MGRGSRSGSRSGLGDRARRHDAAYRRAKREKYAGRAIYKLQEIDKKFRLLKTGSKVLDLGCWPGSWMQYICERIGPEGEVLGIDLQEVQISLPENATTVVGDVEKLKMEAVVNRFGTFDVVLSDMAPHTTGDSDSDVWNCEELFLRALEIAQGTLRPGGHFAAKVFQGGRFPQLISQVKGSFQEAKAYRSPSTRSGSREQYLVGRGLRLKAAKSQIDQNASEGDSAPENPSDTMENAEQLESAKLGRS